MKILEEYLQVGNIGFLELVNGHIALYLFTKDFPFGFPIGKIEETEE